MNLNNKKLYRDLCKVEASIDFFSHPDWLDATVGSENWNVSVIIENSEIVAAMPYYQKKILFFNEIRMPRLTPKLGPWIRKKVSISKEFKYLNSLIDQLPNFSYFHQNWSPNKKYWQPFLWRGYSQSTSYSYILPDLDNMDQIYKKFSGDNRRRIQNAIRNNIRIRDEDNIDSFFKLQDQTFARQNYINFNTKKYILKIEKLLKKKKKRKIFIAYDKNNQDHAGVYIAWDQNTCYYLMGGANPKYRSSGATNLCLWHAIQFSSKVSKKFDFEGSMIQSIDKFFRNFGCEPYSYFSIKKSNSVLYSVFYIIKPFIKKNIKLFLKIINIVKNLRK